MKELINITNENKTISINKNNKKEKQTYQQLKYGFVLLEINKHFQNNNKTLTVKEYIKIMNKYI